MGLIKSKLPENLKQEEENQDGPLSRSNKKMAYFRSLRSTRGGLSSEKKIQNRKSLTSETGLGLKKSKSLTTIAKNYDSISENQHNSPNKLRKSFVNNKNDNKSLSIGDGDTKSTANNDELIADLKKKVDYLSEQLEFMDKEDSKIISELEAKVDNLSQLNSTIMTKFDKHSKSKTSKEDQEKIKQQKALLDQYHARITQQQNQIDQLRLLLQNVPTQQQQHVPPMYNSFVFTHPQQQQQQQQYYHAQQHAQSCNHNHQHRKSYHKHSHKSHKHYYSMPSQQDSSYFMSFTSGQQDSSSTIFYDPTTGQYYYYPQTQQAPSFTYTFTNGSDSGGSDKTTLSTDSNSSDSKTDAKVIITEVTTDDEDSEETQKKKNTKKDYVDAISLDEEKTV